MIALKSPIEEPYIPRLQATRDKCYADEMENYKHGGHTIWDCKYHLVWATKYHYPVLPRDVGIRCRELLREIAKSKDNQ